GTWHPSSPDNSTRKTVAATTASATISSQRRLCRPKFLVLEHRLVTTTRRSRGLPRPRPEALSVPFPQARTCHPHSPHPHMHARPTCRSSHSLSRHLNLMQICCACFTRRYVTSNSCLVLTPS